MTIAAIYVLSTGEIKRVVMCPDDQLPAQIQSGEAYLEATVESDSTHFVVDGGFVQKSEMPVFDKTTIVADGTDMATVSGLPSPTYASISRGEETTSLEITDGVLEITSQVVGSIRVILRSTFQYKERQVLINAT